MSASKIYLTGGSHSRRRVLTVDLPELRLTLTRYRKMLFDWLAPVIEGARCLDCFAGSGALGMEALSRRAGDVLLVERNVKLGALIEQNLRRCAFDRGHVVTADVLRWLAKTSQLFDVVFIDPPFHRGLVSKTASLLEDRHLSDLAWIYVERERHLPRLELPESWRPYRMRSSPRVVYTLYVRDVRSSRKFGRSSERGRSG